MTKQVAKFGVAVMVTLLALVMLWNFRIVVVYVLVSFAFAAALRPLINRLTGRGFWGRMAWIMLYLIALGSFCFLIFLAGETIINEIQHLALTVARQDKWMLPAWLEGSPSQLALVAQFPTPSKLFEAVIGDEGQRILPAIFGITQGLGEIFSVTFVILFLSIYWSIYQIHFERLWLSLLPPAGRIRTQDTWRTIEVDLGAYIRSEVVQSILAAVLLGLGYTLLGSPTPWFLALTGALIWLIPVVGAPLALILPLIMGLLTDAQLSLTTALYTFVILIALQIWIEPHLFKRKWDNPLLTLVILLAAADAFGIPGILVAPPLSAICQILWSLFINNRAGSEIVVQISDLKQRQAHAWETLNAMDEPPIALVTNSMQRLALLIEKAEPILQADISTQGSERMSASEADTANKLSPPAKLKS